MSTAATPSKSGSTFWWVLGAFACFAVLFWVVQSLVDERTYVDPRADTRRSNREQIVKAQNDIVAKMGLNDAERRKVIFEKTVANLGTIKPAASKQVVPGSPTQLKQAAADAAAAPAPAPAAGAAPAQGTAPAAAPAPGTAPAPAPGAAPTQDAVPAPASTPAPVAK